MIIGINTRFRVEKVVVDNTRDGSHLRIELSDGDSEILDPIHDGIQQVLDTNCPNMRNPQAEAVHRRVSEVMATAIFVESLELDD